MLSEHSDWRERRLFCMSPRLNADCLEHSMMFLRGLEVAEKELVEKCTWKEKDLKKDARWFSQQTAPERIRSQIMEKSSGKFHRLCVGISWRRTRTSLKWSSYWPTNGVATFRRVTVWKPSMISREKESANTINAESQRIAMIWLASVFVPDRLCVPVVVASLRRNTSTVIAKIAYYLRVQ